MKSIKIGLLTLLMAVGLIGAPLLAAPAVHAAIDPQTQICSGTGGKGGANGCSGNSTKDDLGGIVKTIVNVLLYIIGAVAVIVIIIAGFRYVTSGGDSSKIAAAKNTILYAVIGLIVAILAYAIVNFVVGAL